MRAIGWTPVVLLLSLVLAACSSNGASDMGVGPDLYTASLPENTKAQNDYVAAICTQAGGRVIELSTSVECSVPDGWSAFVQAGMNDIDNRCDAYLVWLDRRNRSSKPILNQLAQTEGVATTIVNTVSPGTAITVLTAVFGLARDTFNNINSVVLLETIDHSTVQSLVLRRQKAFRDTILGKPISNRPAAIYALRSYLRICMPITIATDINTTITTFERSDREPKPLISADTVAATAVQTPQQPLIFVQRPQPEVPFPEKLPKKHVNDVQASLCVPLSEKVNPETIAAVAAYLAGLGNKVTDWNIQTDKLLPVDVKCSDSGFRNPAEVALLRTQGAIGNLQDILIKFFSIKDPSFLTSIGFSKNGSMDEPTRKAIAKARAMLGRDKNLGSDDRLQQLDRPLYFDILEAIRKGA